MFHVPERYRQAFVSPITGTEVSLASRGEPRGYFVIPPSVAHRRRCALRAVASDGVGTAEAGLGKIEWEHVSVSTPVRCPTWDEMSYVKSMFWDDEDAVIQFHPPRSEYVNCHPYCLHLWRPVGIELPRPPAIMVGPPR